MKTKTLERLPSCLALAATVAILALPILGGPLGWRERILDPCTCLMALTLVGAAMLLWPLENNSVAGHQGESFK
jgi:hypothetical protein